MCISSACIHLCVYLCVHVSFMCISFMCMLALKEPYIFCIHVTCRDLAIRQRQEAKGTIR